MITDVGLDHFYGIKPWWEVARDKILMPRSWFGEMFNHVRKVGLIPLSAIHREEDCKIYYNLNFQQLKLHQLTLIIFIY